MPKKGTRIANAIVGEFAGVIPGELSEDKIKNHIER